MKEKITNISDPETVRGQYDEIISWDQELVGILNTEGLSVRAGSLAMHTGAYCRKLLGQLSSVESDATLTEDELRYLPILRDYCDSVQRVVFGSDY